MKIAKILFMLATSLALHSQAAEIDFPKKPIKILVPYAPGGASDSLARKISVGMQQKLGQNVIVENKPGGGGLIAGQMLATAPADGYTLGVFDMSPVTVIPQLYKKPVYNALNSFEPVIRMVENAQILLVRPDSPINTLQDLIAYVKKNPGASYGAAAAIGINMLDFERFSDLAGIKAQGVGYKGGLPALQDLIGGQLDFGFSDLASAVPFITTHKLKPIAVSSPERLKRFPNVPTIAESGFPGYQVLAWFGVIAPKNTPKDVVDKLHKTLYEIGQTPDFDQWVDGQSFLKSLSPTPQAFGAPWPSEIANYANTAKRLNVQID